MLRRTYQGKWPYEYVGEIESPAVDAFLAELIAVCRKHGMSVSHEDGHGAFEIVPFSDDDADWLMCAADKTGTAGR